MDLAVPSTKTFTSHAKTSYRTFENGMKGDIKLNNIFGISRRFFRRFWRGKLRGHTKSETADEFCSGRYSVEPHSVERKCETADGGNQAMDPEVKCIGYYMPDDMKQTAMELADFTTKTFHSNTDKAVYMKEQFDSHFGGDWVCIVGDIDTFSAAYFYKFGHFVELRVRGLKVLLFVTGTCL